MTDISVYSDPASSYRSTPLERMGELIRGIFDRGMTSRRIETVHSLILMEQGRGSSSQARLQFLDIYPKIDGRGRRFREAQLLHEAVCLRMGSLSDAALLRAEKIILDILGEAK